MIFSRFAWAKLLKVTRGGRVATVESGCDLDGAVPDAPVTGGALSAHSRIDPRTGELVSVTYSTALPPYIRHDGGEAPR